MPKKLIVGKDFAEKVAQGIVNFTLEAPEGETPEVISFHLSNVSDDMVRMLALHGASQKIGDSYAGAKDSGEDPVAYARAAINDTIKQLYDGLWSITRTGSGTPRTSLLVQAYAAVKGLSIETAQEEIGQLTDEEKAVVQKAKKIQAKMAEIRAEAAVARAKKLAEAAAAEGEDE